ncbi:MAG TPA: serine/threonine-protein kinase [Nocardioides sp.]|nr:serine/threonine-protein kinase [Nocardioides sp.]
MTDGATGDGRLLDQRYQLVERIGSGGMGTVYRAHDTLLDRPVAVKLLRASDDDVHRARLRAEARFAAGLQHPGIVRVYDYGEEPGPDGPRPYVVMQLVDGSPLGAPLAAERVARLLVGIGQALAVAHAAGVVHRDLKPSNILVTEDGRPVIVDFGVARSDTAEPLTETGFVVGTAEYLSPEQVEGARATPASDVYALGVVAHQCLSGTSPFQRETPVATALAHLRDDAPELPPGVPAGLRTLLRAMLARTPEERPTAAEVVARAAEAPTTRAIVLPPPPAAPPPPPEIVSPWARRRIAIVAGTAAVLVVAMVLAAFQSRHPTAPAASAAGSQRATHRAAASPTPTPRPTPQQTSTPAPVRTHAPAHHAKPKAQHQPKHRHKHKPKHKHHHKHHHKPPKHGKKHHGKKPHPRKSHKPHH